MIEKTINLNERIAFIKFHQSLSSDSLLAVCMPPSINIYHNFQDTLNDKDSEWNKNLLTSIRTHKIVYNFCWSHETNLNSMPQIIKFYVVDDEHCIWAYTCDVKNNYKKSIVGQHSSFVNALSLQTDLGTYLASVADDNKCCLWSTDVDDAENNVHFQLTSPGINVLWNPKEPFKFMVAEKNGVIRFYSATNKRALFSLDSCQSMLSSCDWSTFNALHVAALVQSDLIIFDTSKSHRPSSVERVTAIGGMNLVWCPTVEHIIAFVNRPKYQLNVLNIKTMKVIYTTDLKSYGGFEWHPYMPYLFVVDDHKIFIINLSDRIYL